MELPNHLRDADAEGEEDLVPQTNNAMFMHMNQSIFGLFGAACSNVDFHNRFEDQSSEDEDVEAPEVPETATNRQEQISGPQQKGKEPSEDPLSRSQFLQKSSSDTTGEKKHKRRISGSLLKSLPQLPSRLVARSKSKSSKSKFKSQPVQEEDGAHDNDGRTYTNSPVDDAPERKSSDPEASSRGGPRSLAPVMSRMLEARAEMSSRPSVDLDRLMGDHRGANAADEEGPSELATTVRDIFELDEPEEVIAGRLGPVRGRPMDHPTDIRNRISLLVVAERACGRIHVYHEQAHLFLGIPTQEGSKHRSFYLSRLVSDKFTLGPSCQVWVPLQERQKDLKTEPLLVPSQGRCLVVLPRRDEPLLPPWPDRLAIRDLR